MTKFSYANLYPCYACGTAYVKLVFNWSKLSQCVKFCSFSKSTANRMFSCTKGKGKEKFENFRVLDLLM